MSPHPSFHAATSVYAFCVRSASHLGRMFGIVVGFHCNHPGAIIYLFLNRFFWFLFFFFMVFFSCCCVGLYVHRNVDYYIMDEASEVSGRRL